MFNIEFIRGDTSIAFAGPHDLIITEEMAHKYFGDEDPVGKTLTYKGIVLTVTCVARVCSIIVSSNSVFFFLLSF